MAEELGSMAEELGSMYECMTLTKQEQEEIHVEASLMEEVISKGAKCVIMKLFIEKYHHKEMFKQTMKKIWRPVHEVKFCDLF